MGNVTIAEETGQRHIPERRLDHAQLFGLATEQSAGIGRRTLVRVWGRRIEGLEQMLLRA